MTAYAYPLLIKQLLTAPIAQASGQEIVYRDLRRHGYPEFHARIGRLGSALSALGVRPGDRVAVMDWDSHRYLECFFAIPMLGATLMTVNIRLSPEQIAYTLNHCEASVILLHPDFLPVLRQIVGELQHARHFVCLPDDGALPDGLDWAGEYEALLAAADPAHAFADFDEATIATSFYTTGTTGAPKGVRFSHRQLVLHTLNTMASLLLSSEHGRFSRREVYMPITPMFHVHAWGFPYVATLAGWKQVYVGRYTPAILVQLHAREGVTFSHCVPSILHMLLNAPEAAGLDLSGWKMIIGGSAMSSGLCRAALARGIDAFSAYGMSETAPLLTLTQLKPPLSPTDPPSEAELSVRTAAGLPAVLAQIRVVDDSMADVAHDGVSQGEIVARSPSLTQSYAKNPEASAALWAGGWLHTGDIGTIDPQGYLRVVDRQKDVIKSGGEWISSLQLEDLISQHPAVSEVAVIGLADARWGERPLALVVAREGAAVTPAEIRAFVQDFADRGILPRYAVPEHIRLVDELPKTSVGKLDKKRLRAAFDGSGG